MPAVSRLGDTTTGHDGFEPRPGVSASVNIFCNSIAVHKVGDPWITHCDGSPSCHGGAMSSGSGTVYVNGQPCGRFGDSISCGDVLAGGSPNVFCG